MKLSNYFHLISLSSASAFIPSSFTSRPASSLNVVVGEDKDVSEKVKEIFANAPQTSAEFLEHVQKNFPGAIDNKELVTNVVNQLSTIGYTPANTLLATSLCCDELARQLEDDFTGVYGSNFNLGGLAGFPFAGDTGFWNMATHIPDDGYCLIVYGPHVGLAADGTVGKVERAGVELIDTCCASAIAASQYVRTITDGTYQITATIQRFTDFQQGAVQELCLPHGKRLKDAENPMSELPYALYESQDVLLRKLVSSNHIAENKKGLALLGGIQINTGPGTLDYFHPLSFDYVNTDGEVLDDMLSTITQK